MMSIGDGVQSGLCPFGMVCIRDDVQLGLCPFGIVYIWDWCPFGIVSIRDSVQDPSKTLFQNFIACFRLIP